MEELNPPPPTWAGTPTRSPLLSSASIADAFGDDELMAAPSSSRASLPRSGLKRSRAIKIPLRVDTRHLRQPQGFMPRGPRRRSSLPDDEGATLSPWDAPSSPRPVTHDGCMPFSTQSLRPEDGCEQDDVAPLKDRLERVPSVVGEHGHDVVFGYAAVSDAREKSRSDLLVALGVSDPCTDSLSAESGPLDSEPSPLTPHAMYSPNSLLRMADHVQHAARSSSPSPLSILCKGYMDMHAQAASQHWHVGARPLRPGPRDEGRPWDIEWRGRPS